jgi:hypothetical protein
MKFGKTVRTKLELAAITENPLREKYLLKRHFLMKKINDTVRIIENLLTTTKN